MRVVHVASEVFPFSRTGGLADVLGALPQAQAHLLGAGQGTVTVVSPWYTDVTGIQEIWRGPSDTGEVRVGEQVSQGVRYLFIGLAEFDRPGLYHPDDVARFCAFGRAVLTVLHTLDLRPTLLHGHDWQAGLTVAHAHLQGISTTFTVHNLAYQGRWNLAEAAGWTGLPNWAFSPEWAEYHGDLNLLKAGLTFAGQVTTVSPTYAAEITTPEYGEGLQGVLGRLHYEGRLSGILNGLDQVRWNPRQDRDIRPYSTPRGKAGNAKRLRAAFQMDQAPVLAAVTRLADQKGIDLLVQALPELTEDWNVIVLGSGDPLLTAALRGWNLHPRAAFVEGLNDPLAHRLYAGADAFAMPSRFEPCGLSQMIALRYGTLPIVRATGGLKDTVPTDIGFVFEEASPSALLAACREARTVRRDAAAWRERASRAMTLDFGWDASARAYLNLYQSLP
ncbi:glycogen synthase [Deinococcus lacus]|uniref:Glycogen synthase n=1 Tax=Deinococcus lacus TaxID=392561 RepID=A0ABW1YDF8_9DEIO